MWRFHVLSGTYVRDPVKESVRRLCTRARPEGPGAEGRSPVLCNGLPQVVRNLWVRAPPRGPALGTDVFRFVFPLLFFFFPFTDHICFSIIESARTDPALAFRHAVLTEPRKQVPPPQLAVWGALENLPERGVSNTPVRTYLTQSFCNRPLDTDLASGSASCRRAACGAGSSLAARRRQEGVEPAGTPTAPWK